MAGLVIGSSTSFVGEGQIGEADAIPALEIAQVDSWEAANSLTQSITPLTGANRMWIVAVFHTDDGIGERTGVTCSYDNTALTPGVKEHVFANAGSFPWGLVQVDVFVANEAFIAARSAGPANLSVQNIGSGCIVALIQLRNAPSDTDVDGSTTGNPGTAASTSVTTTNEGSQTMEASFPSSRYAHVALALVDGLGTTYLFDFLGRNEETATTEGAGQTELLDVAHSGATVLRASISTKEAAAGAGTVTGTVAVTADEATLAVAAAETISGTVATGPDEATLAASGLAANPVSGTVATGPDEHTLAATAAERFDAAVATGPDEHTLAATAAERFAATVAVTADEAQLAAAGTETIAGTVALAADEHTLAATAAERFDAAVAATADEAQLAAAGTETIAGTVAFTADEHVLAVVGDVAADNSVAVTVDEAQIAAVGGLTIAGTVAVTVDEVTLAATAAERFTGAVAVTVDEVTLAATAAERFTGTAAVAADEATITAAGTETIAGAVIVTVDEAQFAAAGTVIHVFGSATVTADEVTLAVTGNVDNPLGPAGPINLIVDEARLASAGAVVVLALESETLDLVAAGDTGYSLGVQKTQPSALSPNTLPGLAAGATPPTLSPNSRRGS